MGLTINQSFAQIGIETIRPKLEMQTTQPKLELRQKHAKITIHTQHPKIQIDQREAFASAGLKSFQELTREQNELAYNQVMEYIGKTAEDGDLLAAIERGGNPIADIAERDGFIEREFGFSMLPKTGPKISLIDGYVWIDPGESLGAHNGVEGQYTPGTINYNYIPGDVKVYLRQKNFLNFVYEPNKIDLYL